MRNRRRQRYPQGRALPACCGLILAALLWGKAAVAVEEEASERLATFDNAAFYYWRAASKLRPAASAEDFETLRFIERELPDLPPQTLGYYPQAARRLMREGAMLQDLNRAARLSVCRFSPRQSSGGSPDVSHRVVMRRVWQRGLAVAKALEFADEDRGAAQVYIDLFRLLDHLDQDLDWATAYVCVQWQPEWIRAVAGYILRNPEETAVQPVLEFLADLESQRFPMQRFTEQERRAYLNWLAGDPDLLPAKLASLYGAQSSQPAVQRVADLNRDERVALLERWTTEYRREVDTLIELLGRPYLEAIEGIQALDARIAEIRNHPEDLDQNHLLPLLMPPMERTFQQFVAAEGACTLLSLLSGGAVYRGMVGAWPENATILQTFAGRTFPPDPFTGEPIRYELRRGYPVVELRAPGWVSRETAAVVKLDLYERFNEDQKKVEAIAERVREERRSRGEQGPG